MNRPLHRYLLLIAVAFFLGVAGFSGLAQPVSGEKRRVDASSKSLGGHGEHQTPAGWKFSWPKGDSVKGREVFVKLECYSCHAIQGEKFPAPGGEIGPELSAMGPLHDAEFFAEAIINPNAVIDKGNAYEAADGSSKMPSYNDLVTVQEVIDLVAYLKGLKPPADVPASKGGRSRSGGGHGRHGGHGAPGRH
jgi:mono/diheme cytochrome c family protein